MADEYKDLAPRFTLAINGIELQEDVMAAVINVEFSEDVNLMDVVRLRINNIDVIREYGAPSQPRFSDSKHFTEGNWIDLSMGYGDDLSLMTRAEIVRCEPNFPRTGVPTLDIFALSKAHRMTDVKSLTAGEKKKLTTANTPHSEIVKTIARHYQLGTSNVEDTKRPRRGTPWKDSLADYEFIKKLADLNGFEFFVSFEPESKTWELNFRTPTARKDPVYNLFYDNGDQTTLFSFRPSFSMRGQSTGIQLVGWDPKRGVPVVVRIEEATENKKKKGTQFSQGGPAAEIQEKIKSGDFVTLDAYGKRIRVVIAPHIGDEATARKWAQYLLQFGRDSFLEGMGEMVGLETIRARQVHNLHGLGIRYSGKYFFTEVTHRMPGSGIGYSMSFRARKVVE